MLACGYASYYPEARSRTGGLLDTGSLPTDEVPCGAPTGNTVQIEVTNYLVFRFDLYEKDSSCTETLRGMVAPDGDGGFIGIAGNVGVIRDEQGGLYSWFVIPTDGRGFFPVTIP